MTWTSVNARPIVANGGLDGCSVTIGVVVAARRWSVGGWMCDYEFESRPPGRRPRSRSSLLDSLGRTPDGRRVVSLHARNGRITHSHGRYETKRNDKQVVIKTETRPQSQRGHIEGNGIGQALHRTP